MWKCSFGWSLLSNKLPIIEWMIIDTDCVMIYCKPLTLNRNKYCHLLPMWANKPLEYNITYPNRGLRNKWKEFWKWGDPNQGLGRGHLSLFQLSGAPLYTVLVQRNFFTFFSGEGKNLHYFQPISTDKLSCDSEMSETENPVPASLVIGRNWILFMISMAEVSEVHVIF